MHLTSTSDLIQLTASASTTINVHAAWSDQTTTTFTPGRTNTAITGTSAITIIGSPAASTYRVVAGLLIRNADGSTAADITITHTDGTTAVAVWKGNLAAGEHLVYDGSRWHKYTSAGIEDVN